MTAYRLILDFIEDRSFADIKSQACDNKAGVKRSLLNNDPCESLAVIKLGLRHNFSRQRYLIISVIVLWWAPYAVCRQSIVLAFE